MTNYNERLDEILSQLMKDAIANRRADDPPQGRKMLLGDAKQAITSLIKELVAEAKPSKYKTDGSTKKPNLAIEYNMAIDQYEQNLLKALEEV